MLIATLTDKKRLGPERTCLARATPQAPQQLSKRFGRVASMSSGPIGSCCTTTNAVGEYRDLGVATEMLDGQGSGGAVDEGTRTTGHVLHLRRIS